MFAFIGIVSMALFSIYTGTHRMIMKADQPPEEVLTAKEAYMFPIYGSCMLGGLYVVLKLVPGNIMDNVITLLFLYISTYSVGQYVESHMSRFGKHQEKASLLIGFVVALAYSVSKEWAWNWMLNNIIGVAFSVTGIEVLTLPSYQVAAAMLCGLFLYDVFWVFGTEVMVTVARKFNAPIKLVFPIDLFAAEWKHSMLGLGDIVIPGFFIALMLRIDNELSKQRGEKKISKVYFTTALISYLVGLTITVFIMLVFKAAQPALLYLVPCVLLSTLSVAIYRGELKKVLACKFEASA